MNYSPSSTRRASLVIVTYNNFFHIGACLRSALNSLSAVDELILVDNASTDGSGELAKSISATVRVVRSETNLGYGGGNNLGARHAHGEYLAFLNSDTTVELGWLEALIEALKTHPQAGLATSKILLMKDPATINTCGNDIHISGLTLCRGMGMPGAAFSRIEEVGAVSGAAFAMRREVFEFLGGFDEQFFMYMEDTDLSLRARLAGWRILYVPTSRVYHDYRLRFGPHKTYYQERNRYLMLFKNYQPRTLLTLLPALLLAELVTWGFVLLHDRNNWTNKLRAYRSVFCEWSQWRQAHHQAQSLRCVPDRELLASASCHLSYEQVGSGAVPRASHLFIDPIFTVLARLIGAR
jgi:hypothetical protein